MKKMSTTKFKISLASLLVAIFFFVGLESTDAQTRTQLGNDRSQEVIDNIRTAGLVYNAQLSQVKSGQLTGEAAIDLKRTVKFHSLLISKFNEGEDLSEVMKGFLVNSETSSPRVSYLSEAEITALDAQIDQIKTSNAADADLDAFHTLLSNSKNN